MLSQPTMYMNNSTRYRPAQRYAFVNCAHLEKMSFFSCEVISMYKTRLLILITLLVPLALSLSSCANYLIAMQMVSAPNDSILGTTVNEQFKLVNDASDEMIRHNGFKRKYTQLNSGQLNSEGLKLSYFDIAPQDYGHSFKTSPVRDQDGTILWIKPHWIWKNKQCFVPQQSIVERGIMMLLHGWSRDSRSMMRYAIAFAQLGYRVIVPDLRGHGQSTGEWLSFGVRESLDISALADHLRLKEFDVLGFSLGAATAIHLGSRDDRVKRIIAVATMHSIEDTIPKFGARSRRWIASLLEGQEAEIIASAEAMTGFDYRQTSDTFAAAAKVFQPTLLVYGENDQMSDMLLNRALYQHLNGERALASMPELRHTFVLQHQSMLMDIVTHWLGVKNTIVEFRNDDCPIEEFTLM